nr:transposase (putative), gypsy type [Tanacetum cinerariifolium]
MLLFVSSPSAQTRTLEVRITLYARCRLAECGVDGAFCTSPTRIAAWKPLNPFSSSSDGSPFDPVVPREGLESDNPFDLVMPPEMDARLDALSIDFDEELYPHMLTAIASRMWMIGHGLRLAMVKCSESLELRQTFADVVSAGIAKGMSEGLRHGVEHGQAQLNLEAIEAYDLEAEAKYIAALHALKNLKYPLVDQLEGLKDAPMDVIMVALHLESDTGDDAPQWVRELRPSSSQLIIPVYLEVRDPMNPWACKEEMLLLDVIAANVSRAEKKKKCRIV